RRLGTAGQIRGRVIIMYSRAFPGPERSCMSASMCAVTQTNQEPLFRGLQLPDLIGSQALEKANATPRFHQINLQRGGRAGLGARIGVRPDDRYDLAGQRM